MDYLCSKNVSHSPVMNHLFRVHFANLYRTCVKLLVALVAVGGLVSCSCERFLKDGESVLSDVKLQTEEARFNVAPYRNYVHQRPNSKWFSLVKVPLGIYCWSSADSARASKGMSKIWRKLGEAPVVYDAALTAYSANNVREAMRNDGYLHAAVDTSTVRHGHKTTAIYTLRPGRQYYVTRLQYLFDEPAVYEAFRCDSTQTLLRRGMPLSLSRMAEERSRVVKALRNRGYYYVNNDFVRFDVDTAPNSVEAGVTLRFTLPQGVDTLRALQVQRLRNVNVYEDIAPTDVLADSTHYRGLNIHYYPSLKQTRRLYSSHVSLRPDSLYRETNVQNTYSNLNALPTVAFSNLTMHPVADSLLDCEIFVKRSSPNSIKAELEGTNTAGDLGAAVALSYSNRNLLRGAEQLTLKFRGAYEAITGLEGYSNRNFIEWSGEAGLRFPTLLLPFVSLDQRFRLKASSTLQLMYDSQDRPEFHRRVLTGAWTYRWNRTDNRKLEHRYDLFSLNYVYMPWISDTFRKDYLEGDDPHYAVLRYSYENLFIMKTGYSFVYNSLRSDAANSSSGLYQTNGLQVKMGVELAGNVLYGLSKLTRSGKNSDGQYNLFGIAYSQYVKLDFDFAKSFVINERNSLAAHVGFGIGIPYGNSTILPYEKRYFAGGANSVRGWSVRDLGPGSYRGSDGKVSFVNQTGNMKLDLNLEFRTYLFWKLHAALFVDAGNVWNTRAYPDMDGAQFHFNSFYRQIAVAYGLGFRLNFDYFILRLDGGMKAINPAVTSGRLHYPVIHPNFSRDFTFHFAVGLPF